MVFYEPTRCESNTCVEVDIAHDGVEVRSSLNRARSVVFTLDEWRAFIAAVRDGKYTVGDDA